MQKYQSVLDDMRRRLSGEVWVDVAMKSGIVKSRFNPFSSAPSKYMRKSADKLESDIRQIFLGVDTSVLGVHFLSDSVFEQSLQTELLALGDRLLSYDLLKQRL